jgi:hypothetical protein
VRHEAPTTGRDGRAACGLSQRVVEAEGSLSPEGAGNGGKQPLTRTGRVGTARRSGSGKRDGEVTVEVSLVR